MIDEIDVKILKYLQEDARMPNAEIARRLNMAPSGILERIRKLEKNGVIKEYKTHLDPKAVDFGLTAFVAVKTNEKRDRWSVNEILAKVPEVLEVHDVAGEECYLIKLRTRDTETLYQLLRDTFGGIPAVAATRTLIVLRTFKETTDLPIKEKEK